MKRRGHKHWQCPKCKATFSSPIPVLAVGCPNRHNGSRKSVVEMQPVEDP